MTSFYGYPAQVMFTKPELPKIGLPVYGFSLHDALGGIRNGPVGPLAKEVDASESADQESEQEQPVEAVAGFLLLDLKICGS